MSIQIKRVYEPRHQDDGTRVLVDRIWPRGVSKKSAAVDLWLREIAPSTELRKWFGHEPRKWQEFLQRYFAELDKRPVETTKLRALMQEGVVTLVYSAKDEQHNQAVALQQYLERLV